MAFESTFKAIDNTLRHDDGCSIALDYVEKSLWVLILPLTEANLEDFLTRQETKSVGQDSWTKDVSTLGEDFDLSVKNPNKMEEVDERTPEEIHESLASYMLEPAHCLKR